MISGRSDYNFSPLQVNTQGEKNGFSKLTKFQVIQIKQLLAKGKHTQKTIGSQFNILRETISSIKNGRRWQELIILPKKTVASSMTKE
jgi:DNA-binding XRE family transcriptional regulator